MESLIDVNFDYVEPAIFSADDLLQCERDESYKLFRQAVDDIKILRKEFITVCACSFGKDSTVVLLAALNAHIELIQEGILGENDPFVVSHIDTGVENHLMQMLCHESMDNLERFCVDNGIYLELHVGRPPLAKQWASLFLSGLKIISSARTNNDCAEIMKVDNAAKLEKQIEKKFKGRVVTLLGSRSNESARRGLTCVVEGQIKQRPWI